MPVYEEPDVGTGGPSSAPASAPPTVVLTPPAGPTGLRGRARWEAAQKTQPGLFAGYSAYQQWARELQDDPTDAEYQYYVDRARKIFLSDPTVPLDEKIRGLAQAAGEQTGKKATRQPRNDTGAPGPSQQSAGGPVTAASADLSDVAPSAQKTKFEKEVERPSDVAAYRRPVFKGRPVGNNEVYTSTPADPYMAQFLQENGIPVTTGPGGMSPDQERAALRSGNYVYMGKEHSNDLNADRDVYMFEDDAKAAAMHVESSVIKQYQEALGLTVTGLMDPYLLGQWDQAVQMAQRSAQAGDKMSVREWFDILMSSVISQKRKGAGGGGSQMEEMDYYRAMMQVLGDISGVGNG